MDNFYSLMQDFVGRNKSVLGTTENGAIGYKNTKSVLLDMNFKLASYRSKDVSEIVADVKRAYSENAELTLKFLFYARDILEGAGERRFFREAIKCLANDRLFPAHLIKYIADFGRWDDVIELLDTPVEEVVINEIKIQLQKDITNYHANKSISLLAKWLPSINTSSADTRKKAYKIAYAMNLTPRIYRKTLAKLRSYLNIVECKMCSNQWSNITYEAVPSKANLLYKNAFINHDYSRRVDYLNNLVKGKTKINTSTAFPYDIVHSYMNNSWYGRNVKPIDITLEEMWKSLKNTDLMDNTLVVADGSGSMTSTIGMTNITALDVANSLAIYFAERAKGVYKNKYITFSYRPQFVDFTECNTLHDKIKKALKYNEIASTNIEKVFDLILSTALSNRVAQKDIPKYILIISDMEFNSAVSTHSDLIRPLFENIAAKYNRFGYSLPHLVFWNVNSRTNIVPITENENGVTLVSGFSPSVMKMVMTNELDPYKALVKTLSSERYAKITLKN